MVTLPHGDYTSPDAIEKATKTAEALTQYYFGPPLGLLWGGNGRVFTIEFHAKDKRWHAYTGGLVSWMKTALADE